MGTAVASAGLAELTRAVGGGYHGPPELTVARAFTEWTLDPWMLALVLILGGGYLAGARRQPGWPVARRIWFLGLGLGFLVVATMSWVGVYQPVLFYARAVQTVLTFLALMASCFAFFWTLLRVDPVPKEYSYAVSMWITGAEVIGDAFSGSPSSPARISSARPGTTRWPARGDPRRRRIRSSAGEQADERPWWEDDPRFTGRFKPT
jgi:hypothetical protein